METGLVGLGRTGANSARRWQDHGHRVIGCARTEETVRQQVAGGAVSEGASSLEGVVSDPGEGRWTSIAAIETSVPAPVMRTALYSRFASRGEDDHGSRVHSAMRLALGGHHERSLRGEEGQA